MRFLRDAEQPLTGERIADRIATHNGTGSTPS